MSPSRRRVIQLAASATALSALGLTARAAEPEKKSTGASKRILILGGTGFLGPAIVAAAQAKGHQVTLFNRGKTRPGLFPNLDKRLGDRDPNKGEGLKSLESGEWDAVIDDSGFYPRMVGASAQLLSKRVKQYIYISSISCYREGAPENSDENTPLATMADPTLETMGKNFENYGALKALCEKAAEKALPGRTTVVRPGFIVGPDDPTGRFTYWPVRFDKGGEIAVPGAPADPLQLIDVRDLAEWLILLVEKNTIGTFNGLGPEKRMSWGRVIEACRMATPTAATVTWIPAEFVAKQEGAGFPIWVPYLDDSKGFHTWSNARAVNAGLKFRPVELTVKDTLVWYQGQLKEKEGRVKLAMSAEQEGALLKAWKDSRPAKAG
ncbi:MAG: NAD-dependent epimerase/dehydratase family protein [Betaproteobacteria bacterium]